MNTTLRAVGIASRIVALTVLTLLSVPANAAVQWLAYNQYYRATPLEACQAGFTYKDRVTATRVSDTRWECAFDGQYVGTPAMRYGSCDAGTVFNTTTGTCDSTGCAGYASPTAAATAYQWLQVPISCGAIGSNGVATCTGLDPNGKSTSQDIQCNGGTPGGNSGPVPAPVPDPPPPVDVAYPKCPVGSYEFTDTDGTKTCAVSGIPISPTANCTSGNVGTINGVMTCLPANPAPNVAKNSASAAQAKADAAKAAPGTDAARAAAKGASADAQRATDAESSLPSDSPLRSGTSADAERARNAAKQAAGYAGEGYTGPGGALNGTEGPKECGGPGRPPCKIDESGTPNGEGAVSQDGLNGAFDSAGNTLNTVTSSSGKDTSWGWSPLSWVQPGACQPVDLGTMPIGAGSVQFASIDLTFDFCPQLATASEFISFMWVMATIWLVLSMVWATVNNQGS